MQLLRASLFVTAFIISSTCAFADRSDCPDHYVGGQAPDIVNQKMTAKNREVCYSGYGVLHSGVTRTPLYAGEYLTRSRLMQGKGLKRQSKFHPDENIPSTERAELHHYARSGYDRGHVAPSGDMFDLQSQQESFSLANMVPQEPSVNRGVWEGIESAVRKLAKERGELYVVTGPLFQGSQIQRIGGAVMVPTRMFKAVYDPRRKEAGAYIVENAEGAKPLKLSIAELEKQSGISIFPALDSQTKIREMSLPDPKERKHKGGRK